MRQLLNKQERIEYIDSLYEKRPHRPAFYSEIVRENRRLLRFLIPEGASILDIGCGDGNMLASLLPTRGVGIDWSGTILELARKQHPHLEFVQADAEEELSFEGEFDYILFNLSVGDMLDVLKALRNVRKHCKPDTRIVVTYYNSIWDPAISLATLLGIRRKWLPQNWLSVEDIENLLFLSGFETIHKGTRTLFPFPIPFVAGLCNRLLAKLPILRHLNILTYNVARPLPREIGRNPAEQSVSIIIPTRNEKGNIEGAVERTPELGSRTELIFVDGDSSDGTVEEIEKFMRSHGDKRDIQLIHQIPPGTSGEEKKVLKLGKGDAVRKGFDAATGDILMILDSDLTVPPEEMDKFYLAMKEGRADFINGNRLSYPMERDAMRFLNLVANRIFGIIFTWLLGQRVKDTLCGTKVLSKEAYGRIRDNRAYFGEFDPFGDFDLLFGAAKQNLKITDLPVRYCARAYGDIKIERFKHGLILLKMCAFAFRRFKLE